MSEGIVYDILVGLMQLQVGYLLVLYLYFVLYFELYWMFLEQVNIFIIFVVEIYISIFVL